MEDFSNSFFPHTHTHTYILYIYIYIYKLSCGGFGTLLGCVQKQIFCRVQDTYRCSLISPGPRITLKWHKENARKQHRSSTRYEFKVCIKSKFTIFILLAHNTSFKMNNYSMQVNPLKMFVLVIFIQNLIICFSSGMALLFEAWEEYA